MPPEQPLNPPDYCWIATQKLESGMVLARPVSGGRGINSAIQLSAGSVVTGAMIEQLINKGIEAVAVFQDLPDPEVYGLMVKAYIERLVEIFGPDPSDECRALLDTLIACGPHQC
jgi:hypothetical protein